MLFRSYSHFLRYGSFALLIPMIVNFALAGSIRGVIRNSQTHKPLYGVLIEHEGSDMVTHSDSIGVFSFDSVAPDPWDLHYFHEKTEPVTLNDVVIAGDASSAFGFENDTFFVNESIEQEQQPSIKTTLNLPYNITMQVCGTVKRCDIDIDIKEQRHRGEANPLQKTINEATNSVFCR